MKDLFDAALGAFGNAHAPYSGFRVGAAVRSESGAIFAGANVENASYPEGSCAETGAIAAMVAAGERRIIEALVLAAGERLCTPCGGCRQRLAELAAPELPVHLCDPDGLRRTVTLGELLPLSFTLGDADNPAPPSPIEGEGVQTIAPLGRGSGWGVISVDAVQSALDVIRTKAPGFVPKVGMILGSGLGGLADAVEGAIAIPYAELPGFPRPSVEGHEGRLVLGRLSGVPVACLQGRAHLYEGVPAAAVNGPVRTLRALGCEILVLTNASGSLNPDLAPGTLVAIADHVNLLGQNPLAGPNDAEVGPRFPDMSEVYDAVLRERARKVGKKLGIPLASGIYLAALGPCFETPAEIRAFRALGADLVGMSTVPEAISARHAGMKVLGISIVTNLAAGLNATPLAHEETLARAAEAGESLKRLLLGLLGELAHGFENA
jgi:homotetrameric cytidine deaminase